MAIVVALCLTVFLGFVALGVSAAGLFYEQRRLQGHADLAAVAGAGKLEQAGSRSTHVLGRNGRTADSLEGLAYARFFANPDIAIPDRLEPRPGVATGANAVTVTVGHDAPLNFASLILGRPTTHLRAEATATRQDAVTFSLGSRLARLDAGVVNSLLTEALGSRVSLDIADYDALAAAEVDLVGFLEALATEMDFEGGNYLDILALEARLPQVLRALGAASPTGVAPFLAAFAETAAPRPVKVSRILSVSDPDLGVTLLDFIDETQITALPLLAATADVVNAERSVALDTTLAVPGLLGQSMNLRVSERPAGSGWVTVGEPGSTLHTAQTRLKTELELAPGLLDLGLAGVEVTALHLPLYLETASATAALAAIGCQPGEDSALAARFDTGIGTLEASAGTHVAQLLLGTFDPPAEDSATPLDPATLDYADFLDLRLLGSSLITIQARSHVTVGQSAAGEVAFDHGDLASLPATRTVGSGALLGTAVSSLLSSEKTEFRVSSETTVGVLLAGTVNLLLGALPAAVAEDLTGPVDQALDEITAIAGVGLGEADLSVQGHHCGLVRLVR